MSLETTPLGDVLSITSGFAFKSKFFNEIGNGLPLIRCRDVNTGDAGVSYDGPFRDDFVVEDGDLLVSMDGDFRVVRWDRGRALLNQRVCRLEPDPQRIDSAFLLHLLPRELDGIHSRTSFATVKHLSAKALRQLSVPLPPLIEQKRIAEILDAADALRAKRREALAQIDTLLQSTFLDMFGDPVTNPMGWILRSLSDCAIGIVDGPFGSNLKTKDYVAEGVPVLQGKNITGNRFRFSDIRFVSPEKAETLKRSEVRLGDHLLIKIGSIGYSAVLDDLGGAELGIIPANMIRVRRDPEVLEEAFLRGFLTTTRVTHLLRGLASKTAQPALSLKKVRRLRVPVPPLHLQGHFGRAVAAMDRQRSLHETHLAELESLFASLQSRAFRGEL